MSVFDLTTTVPFTEFRKHAGDPDTQLYHLQNTLLYFVIKDRRIIYHIPRSSEHTRSEVRDILEHTLVSSGKYIRSVATVEEVFKKQAA